jgi:hypothetical protein
MTMIAGTPLRVYVLDTGIAIALQRAGHLSVLGEVSTKTPLIFLEEVVDELTDVPSKHAKRAQEIQGLLATSSIRQESIDASDPAGIRLGALRAGKTSGADVGEAASIAWAADKTDAIFVTRDEHAALRGLEELRGRTVGFFGWIAELVEIKALDASVARQIGDDVLAAPGVCARQPLWWRDWLARHVQGSAVAPRDSASKQLASIDADQG